MSIRTNPPHLDRLSALLEGALPRIELLRLDAVWPAAASELRLWLLLRGSTDLGDPSAEAGCEPNGKADEIHSPARLAAPALLLGSATPEGWPNQSPSADWLRLQIVFDGPAGPLLAAQFTAPRIIACAAPGAEALAQVLALIGQEAQAPRCGQPALLKRAGEILFITLLRHLIERPAESGELFRGLADARLARVLVAVHERPAAPWTLESLAATAGMSRTAFANAFRNCLRQTPGHYLGELRLALARRMLAQGKSLKEAARHSAYRSGSALSKALSRSTARHGKKATASEQSDILPTTAIAVDRSVTEQAAGQEHCHHVSCYKPTRPASRPSLSSLFSPESSS